MAAIIPMPALGESVTEGTVTRWLKGVGDTVEVDEPLVEVSTDKVDTEIPSPAAGVLTEILAREDETVAVGAPLAIIGGGEDTPVVSTAAEQAREREEPAAFGGDEHVDAPNAVADVPPTDGDAQAVSVPMPELGESVTEGAVTRWLKAVGEFVSAGEPLVEVSTDKVDTEIPSPVTGVLLSVTAAEGETISVGGELARVGDATPTVKSGTATVESSPTTSNVSAPKVVQEQAPEPDRSTPPAETAPFPRPAPRPSAKSFGVSAAEGASLRGTVQKANRIRQLTGKKTRESLQTTAQLTQVHEVDMTRIAALRTRWKKEFAAREGVNLTYLPFVASAVVYALQEHPNINASYDETSNEITYHDVEHLGFAVDTEQGLLSPVIHDAGRLSLAGLARAISDIAARARSGGLKPDDLSGGTFTITNIGSEGGLFDTPILIPGQGAMLATGAIVKRPRVVIDEFGNESIGVRAVGYLPMTYDHRLIDGADAGRFLTTVRRRLEEGPSDAELALAFGGN